MYKYKTIIFNLDGILFQTDTISRGDIINEDLQHRRVIIKTIEGKLLLENESLYDEVVDMLDRLKKYGYTLCLCSNGSSEDVYNMLNAFGLEERFSVIKSRIKGLCKSQLIKQILDESACCSAIVVGERLIDYEAANDAGCLSIGVSYGYGNMEYEKADFLANSLMDVYHMINKVNNLYNNILHQIISKKNKNSPFIVGINGVDTSGKTEFTRELSNYIAKSGFKVQTINIDDFHNPLSIRLKDKDPVISYTNNAFDLKRLETELLEEVAKQGFIKKILDIGFGEFGFNRVWLRVLEHNTRAIKCYKRVGFIQEGICREESLRKGQFKNQVQMSILKSEWIQR